MNKHASECRPPLSARTHVRWGFCFVFLVCGPALHAQLTLSQTNNTPHSVDGGAFPVFFNLSSQLPRTDAGIVHTRLSIDFSKAAALFDDPPYYSDIGLVLRKLDETFSVTNEVRLIDVGSFNDGLVATSFDGVITFDDAAPTTVNNDPDQLKNGFFRPVESLSFLNGTYSPYWELRLVDAVSDSPLLFHSATLSTTISAAVPEPAVFGVLGSACLLGLGLLRRRQLAAA